jgi:hypothetical protein
MDSEWPDPPRAPGTPDLGSVRQRVKMHAPQENSHFHSSQPFRSPQPFARPGHSGSALRCDRSPLRQVSTGLTGYRDAVYGLDHLLQGQMVNHMPASLDQLQRALGELQVKVL